MSATRVLEVCLIAAIAVPLVRAQAPERWTEAMSKGEQALMGGDHRTAAAAFAEACAVKDLDVEGLALCTHGQGVAAQLAGDFKKAMTGYEQALALWEKIPDAIEFRCATLVNLGQIYRDLRDWDRAVATLRKTRQIALQRLGPRSAVYGRAVAQLGIVLEETGDPREAQALLREGIEVLRQANPVLDQDVAVPMASLAHLYAQEWKFAEARPLLEEAARIMIERLGDSHPQTATVVTYQAALYRATGETSRAWPLLRRAQSVVEKSWGRNHPWMASVLAEQASLAATEGKTSMAIKLLNQAGDIFAAAFGEDSVDFAMVQNNVGEILMKRGQLREAEPLLTASLKVVERAYRDPHANVAAVHANLAELYGRQRAASRAEEYYKSAIAMYRSLGGEDDRRLAYAMAGYARLLQPSRRTQAEELNRESKRILGRK